MFQVGWGERANPNIHLSAECPPGVRLVVENPRERVYSLLGFASSPQQPGWISCLCATVQAFALLNPQILQNHLATMRAVPYFHRAECFFQGRLPKTFSTRPGAALADEVRVMVARTRQPGAVVIPAEVVRTEGSRPSREVAPQICTAR